MNLKEKSLNILRMMVFKRPEFGLLKYAERPWLVTSNDPENLENPEKLRYRGGLSGVNLDNRTVSKRVDIIHCQHWRVIPDIRDGMRQGSNLDVL